MFLKKMLKILQINWQGFKIKSFSLLEVIIAIVLLYIISSFAISKFSEVNNKKDFVSLKSELSLIQNGISQLKSKNILLANDEKIDNLDNASINKKNEPLFKKVIDFPLISTDSGEKKTGKWSKISSNEYVFYLNEDFVTFYFEDEKFLCKSSVEVCKEIE